MEEETRKGRMLEAVELAAAELERLRVLKEYEFHVRVEEEGDLYVRPLED